MSSSADNPSVGDNFTPREKVVLIAIDGWGFTSQTKGNAIHQANTQNMDRLAKQVKQYREQHRKR